MPGWVTVVGVILIIPSIGQTVAQGGSTLAPDAKRNLMDLIESDRSKGEWVFYRQRFLDTDNQWAQYEGSVYAAVKNLKIEKC